MLIEDITRKSDLDLDAEVKKFAEWAGKRLNIQSLPEIELSQDTQDAQDNHHTGSHVEGSDSIWVYAKNRNLVDILRTTFHELVHVRQGEIGMIMPITDGARFDGRGRGWYVYPPGSSHFPTVQFGKACILYLLPEGSIAFTGRTPS